jgi:hypothetical protein
MPSRAVLGEAAILPALELDLQQDTTGNCLVFM